MDWDIHAVVNALRDAPWPSEVKLLLYPIATRCGGQPKRVISLDRLALDTGLSRSTLQRWIKAADALFLEVFGVPLTSRTEGGAHLFDLTPLKLTPVSICDPCQIDTRVNLTYPPGQLDLPPQVKLTPIKQARKKEERKEQQQAARTHEGARKRAALIAAPHSAALLASASGGLAPPSSFSLSGSGSSAPWIRGVVQLLPSELQRERGVEEILGAYSEGTARAGALRTARAAAKGGLRSPLAYLRSCLERIKADGGGERPPEPPAPQRQDGGIGQVQKGEVEVESLESLHARFERGEDIGEEGELRLWPELRGQGARLAEMISWGAVFPPPLHQRREDHV